MTEIKIKAFKYALTTFCLLLAFLLLAIWLTVKVGVMLVGITFACLVASAIVFGGIFRAYYEHFEEAKK